MNRIRELVLLALSTLCTPIAVVDWRDVFFDFDTNLLFSWGSYSSRSGLLFPISYPDVLWYRFPNLTYWILSLLWVGVTIVSYFILRRGRDITFARDIALLAALIIGQVLVPLALFALAVQGTPAYIVWILPFPGPSLIAMALRVFYRIRVKE